MAKFQTTVKVSVDVAKILWVIATFILAQRHGCHKDMGVRPTQLTPMPF